MKEHPISQLSPFTDYIALSPLAPVWLLISSSSEPEQRPKPAENYLVVWGFFSLLCWVAWEEETYFKCILHV